MENEFTFSKDYAAIFAAAKKIGNIQDMEACFNELCAEVGHSNQALDLSSAESGKKLAEFLNAKDAGIGGKKI
jgi:hypothetical protein